MILVRFGLAGHSRRRRRIEHLQEDPRPHKRKAKDAVGDRMKKAEEA